MPSFAAGSGKGAVGGTGATDLPCVTLSAVPSPCPNLGLKMEPRVSDMGVMLTFADPLKKSWWSHQGHLQRMPQTANSDYEQLVPS